MTDNLSMDDFELEIKIEFLREALMNLEDVESSFLELESSHEPGPLLEKIFRLAHNLKGGSLAVGFEQVGEFTHHLESLVLKIQKGEIALNRAIVSVLLKANDRLIKMHKELQTNMSAQFDNTEIVYEIKLWIQGVGQTATVEPAMQVAHTDTAFVDQWTTPETSVIAEMVPSTDTVTKSVSEPLVEQLDNVIKLGNSTTVKTEAAQQQAGKADEIVRVKLSKIDNLNDYVGELIVLQSFIEQQISDSTTKKLQDAVRQMVKLSKDIQGISMSLKLLPIKPLIQKLQRAVRDTAGSVQKEVNLVVKGEGLDIDKSVLDQLADPLIHILRNAVDHGLESSVDRSAIGKPATGTIELSLENKGNFLIVEVKDDGGGINLERVATKAIEKGIIPENHNLSEKELINLIFHPGFSTKEQTTVISGRGVGMDVVKTNIEKVGGRIQISTELGKGSVFHLEIPLSLAVIDALIVTSKNRRFLFPLAQIQETINLRAHKVFENKIGIGNCFELRGEVVTLSTIDEVVANAKVELNRCGTALIINVEGRSKAIVVDEIVKLQQVVIKPFNNGIEAQKGWIGASVLGDGLPSLILSPVDLLKKKTKNNDVCQIQVA